VIRSTDEFCTVRPFDQLDCGCSYESPCPFKSSLLLTAAEKSLAGRLLSILAAAMLSISERFVGERDIRERFPEARLNLPVFDHQHMSAYERSAGALTHTDLARPVVNDSPVHELLVDARQIIDIVTSRSDLTKQHLSFALDAFFRVDEQNGLNGLSASLVDAFAASGLVTLELGSAFYGWGQFDIREDANQFWSAAMRPYFDHRTEPADAFFARVCGPSSDGDFDWTGIFASTGN
jgi:hypothetical protein